jgi:serine/threonine-protein phosphatase 2A regulatory subunit A
VSWCDVLQRLATGEWFTSRVSSCGAFVSAYPPAPEGLRGDLRALFAHLCRDDTPMVRRAAAQNLAAFARIVEPDLVPTEFLPLFQYLTQDGERSPWLLKRTAHVQ